MPSGWVAMPGSGLADQTYGVVGRESHYRTVVVWAGPYLWCTTDYGYGYGWNPWHWCDTSNLI